QRGQGARDRRPPPRRAQGSDRDGSRVASLPAVAVASAARRARRGRRPRLSGVAGVPWRQGRGHRRGSAGASRSPRHRGRGGGLPAAGRAHPLRLAELDRLGGSPRRLRVSLGDPETRRRLRLARLRPRRREAQGQHRAAAPGDRATARVAPVRIAVLGGGAWGTSLAAHAVRAGHAVHLWMRREESVQDVLASHQNRSHLPGVTLPDDLVVSSDLASVVGGAEAVVSAVPSEWTRAIYRELHPVAPPPAPLVSATKGLETGTLRRMSELAAEEAPSRAAAVLSGPSFALEVARELPTALVAASTDPALAESVQQALSTRALRVYRSDDVVGVELGGALKDVIAIAAGEGVG